MQTFSYIELNVGLCIRRLVNQNDWKAAHPLLDRLTTHQKLEALKELLFYRFSEDNPKLVSDFDEWFKKAAKIKSSRNRHVHGLWEYNRMIDDKPIQFRPIVWSPGVGKPISEKDEVLRLSFSEFEQIVKGMTTLLDEFSRLIQKYPF